MDIYTDFSADSTFTQPLEAGMFKTFEWIRREL